MAALGNLKAHPAVLHSPEGLPETCHASAVAKGLASSRVVGRLAEADL